MTGYCYYYTIMDVYNLYALYTGGIKYGGKSSLSMDICISTLISIYIWDLKILGFDFAWTDFAWFDFVVQLLKYSN